MNLSGRPSSREDRETITELMKRNLGLPKGSPAIEPSLQEWKYWKPHPLFAGSRGYLLQNNGRLVSHGCRWPIRLRTVSGDLDCFHLIDWVADPGSPGAGIKLLRECADGLAAVFSIGGTTAGQRVVSAFGFKPANQVWQLGRPLRVWNPARDTVMDWRLPGRWLRNSWQTFVPRMRLRPGWHGERVEFADIPEHLFPICALDETVSMRDARLLAHIAACPRFEQVKAYLLSNSSRPVAYFVLAQVGWEVRLIDFGPAALDAATARMLGACAQQFARTDFQNAAAIVTTTTEPAVREGLLRSGLREHRQRMLRVLPLKPVIRTITKFRLTMIDWDIVCL
jgi:hypothetical protein